MSTDLESIVKGADEILELAEDTFVVNTGKVQYLVTITEVPSALD